MVDASFNAQANFVKARAWLRNCREFHSICTYVGNITYPSRLIDVGETAFPTKVRLVSTAALNGDVAWVALSYCLGGPQTASTRKENVRDHYNQVLIDHLPPSIRDAIHVT